MRKTLIITIVLGTLLVGCIIVALAAKGVMDTNAEFEQNLGLIIEGIIVPPTPEYISISEGHAAYQNALQANQIALFGAITSGFAFGLCIRPFLKRRN